MHRRTRRERALAATSLCALSVAAALTAAPAAPAQDQGQDQGQPASSGDERIVVTGSRIQRRDYEANSPLVTVDSDAFESRNGLNIESYLNQLPQFNPASAPTQLGQEAEGSNNDVAASAVRSVGIATISLRGLGPNRSLLLIDGKRPTPINALMVTDTNTIPAALIDRVEIITGGASAVYGADAVGGVVNFILKDDLEGLEVDAQYGTTEAGDGDEMRLSAVAGADFGDDRGNITVGFEHYVREPAYRRKRDFFLEGWKDPYTPGGVFVHGFGAYRAAFNGPNLNAVDAIFDEALPNELICANGPDGPGTNCSNVRLGINPDGTLFDLNFAGEYRFQLPDEDGLPYGLVAAYNTNRVGDEPQLVYNMKYNDPNQLASAPQSRYAVYASTRFDISDSVAFFARGNFAESKTSTSLLQAPFSFAWEGSVPYDPDKDSPVDPTLDYTDPATLAAVLADPAAFANPHFIPTGAAGAQHPVPLEVAVLLNSRGGNLFYCAAPSVAAALDPAGAYPCGDGTQATTDPLLFGTQVNGVGNLARWVPELYPKDSFGNRRTDNVNDYWQFETGLQGDLPVKDWTWEAYVSHGESSSYTYGLGYSSLERWRAIIDAPDYGRGAEILGNQDSVSPGFGAGLVTCESGYYDTIFHFDVTPSQDCLDAVTAKLQTRTQVQQTIGELNFEGGVLDLPAGELRAALGFQWREENAQFHPDVLASLVSFTDQVAGIYPEGSLDAQSSAADYYAEAAVPLLAGLPFVQDLGLELGARYTEYADTDSAWTYKVLGDWAVAGWIRLRGGYNRASRAPNLGELYLGKQEFFTIGGANFGDPCAGRSNAPWGAAGVAPDPIATAGESPPTLAAGQTLEGAQSTYLICLAQMTDIGKDQFYRLTDAGGQAGTVFNWIYQQGNPDLEPEVADTWTFGAVLSSPFDAPWLSGLTGSIDWYKIGIDDAIQLYSSDYSRYLCYGTVIVHTEAEAAAQAQTRACQNAGRNAATGGQTTALVAYDNQATIETSGVDVALAWRADFEDLGVGAIPGGLGITAQASILDYYRTKQSPLPFDPETEWKGSLGPTLTGTSPGAYDYRLVTSLNYFVGDLSTSLRWRYIPEVWSASYAQTEAVIENNRRVAAGGDGTILSYTPPTDIKAKDYSVFDVSANWQITDSVTLRLGVDNVLDTDPVRTGRSAGYPYDPNKSFAENEAARLAVCDGQAPGCQNPNAYSLPAAPIEQTSGGYYDVLGRRFFVGLKMSF